MITNEQAFNMLPHAVEAFEKIGLGDFIKKNRVTLAEGADKEAAAQEQGSKLIGHILKNAHEIKGEIFNIVAIAEGKTPEQVAQDSVATTLQTLRELVEQDGLIGFFTQAIK